MIDYEKKAAENIAKRESIRDRDLLRVYRIEDAANMPAYGTQGSACFDISACLIPGKTIKGYKPDNTKCEFTINDDWSTFIPAGYRMLVPTGLIFDLMQHQSLRLHPRSSVAIKRGLMLPNSQGIVDSDYFHETFIPFINVSDMDEKIRHGDRLAQGEIVRSHQVGFREVFQSPAQKTDRLGGIGSTG